jgi:hypothetical protein
VDPRTGLDDVKRRNLAPTGTRTNLRQYLRMWSRYSAVGIVTGYGLVGRGSIPGKEKIFIHSVHIGSGAHPAPYKWVPGALSP